MIYTVSLHNLRNLEAVTGNIQKLLRLCVHFITCYALCRTGATNCSGRLKWLMTAEVYLKLSNLFLHYKWLPWGSVWTFYFQAFSITSSSQKSLFFDTMHEAQEVKAVQNFNVQCGESASPTTHIQVQHSSKFWLFCHLCQHIPYLVVVYNFCLIAFPCLPQKLQFTGVLCGLENTVPLHNSF
jgi:hypothetical protein